MYKTSKEILTHTHRYGGYTHSNKKEGYAVGHTELKPCNQSKDYLNGYIQSLIDSKIVFGIWLDNDNNLVIDLIKIINDFENAKAFGYQYHQKAIYNLSNDVTIIL